jgi:hypothetical protein
VKANAKVDRVLTAFRLVKNNKFAELEDLLLEGVCLLYPTRLGAVLCSYWFSVVCPRNLCVRLSALACFALHFSPLLL